MTFTAHLIYILLWLGFGAMHSILAGPKAKSRLEPLLGRVYRLSYNVFALLHIALVIYGGHQALGSDALIFNFSPITLTALKGMTLLGAVIFTIALFQYDLGRFSGFTQLLSQARREKVEPLHLGGLHRFVRHPLYSGAHLYLWGTVRTEFDLATAIWASAYLIIGSHFEEQKLIRVYGEAYQDYRDRVPSVIPWRGPVFRD